MDLDLILIKGILILFPLFLGQSCMIGRCLYTVIIKEKSKLFHRLPGCSVDNPCLIFVFLQKYHYLVSYILLLIVPVKEIGPVKGCPDIIRRLMGKFP